MGGHTRLEAASGASCAPCCVSKGERRLTIKIFTGCTSQPAPSSVALPAGKYFRRRNFLHQNLLLFLVALIPPPLPWTSYTPGKAENHKKTLTDE